MLPNLEYKCKFISEKFLEIKENSNRDFKEERSLETSKKFAKSELKTQCFSCGQWVCRLNCLATDSSKAKIVYYNTRYRQGSKETFATVEGIFCPQHTHISSNIMENHHLVPHASLEVSGRFVDRRFSKRPVQSSTVYYNKFQSPLSMIKLRKFLSIDI